MIRSYGINVYPGGTFFEVAFTQDRVEEYFYRCKDLGITYIEMSVSYMPNDRNQDRSTDGCL